MSACPEHGCRRCRGALVYIAYSADGAAIYVGRTENWTQRYAQHRARSPWMSDVAYFETEPCADQRQAIWLEGVLIRQLNPIENVQGKDPKRLAWRDQFRAAS